ncbi:predicted protein [Lodderomyces elongisporus NRRL YB-4239]|uniref:BZIP domain-containing protein n=1 Tax=Lodderomyces elongisporus (strain ATCC 11503 / CBS 2605 / JCM 1781 / NBRC 1676 / NRRL YB-4239) TaxID=379508 RepID=A5DV94_LODEL|nr:predicted protein [Lodderomyces elongisporus NRRL YB-4239]
MNYSSWQTVKGDELDQHHLRQQHQHHHQQQQQHQQQHHHQQQQQNQQQQQQHAQLQQQIPQLQAGLLSFRSLPVNAAGKPQSTASSGSSSAAVVGATTAPGSGSSPHIDASNTDPALSTTPSATAAVHKYNLKQISQTKRAEQNRNAQRAFRQRKEKYVQDLEAKSQELEELKSKFKNLNNENVQLKDYVMILQRKIIELTQGKDMDHSHDGSISNPFGTK